MKNEMIPVVSASTHNAPLQALLPRLLLINTSRGAIMIPAVIEGLKAFRIAASA
jgi:hypothetical protein